MEELTVRQGARLRCLGWLVAIGHHTSRLLNLWQAAEAVQRLQQAARRIRFPVRLVGPTLTEWPHAMRLRFVATLRPAQSARPSATNHLRP